MVICFPVRGASEMPKQLHSRRKIKSEYLSFLPDVFSSLFYYEPTLNVFFLTEVACKILVFALFIGVA